MKRYVHVSFEDGSILDRGSAMTSPSKVTTYEPLISSFGMHILLKPYVPSSPATLNFNFACEELSRPNSMLEMDELLMKLTCGS